jgi:hypothetical protein
MVSCTPEDCVQNPELEACSDINPNPDDGQNGDQPPGDQVGDNPPVQDPPGDGDDGDEPPVGRDPSNQDFDWLDNSEYIADTVDPLFSQTELSKFRSVESFSRGDDCHQELQNNTRFADAIGFFIDELSSSRKVQLQSIASFYNMSSNPATYFPVGLISHPLCRVTRGTLGSTIRNVPNNSTIALAQRFADDHNRYRSAHLSGDTTAYASLQKHWGAFFGCLAYTESLSTADTSLSRSTASRYAPSGYRKPAGVKFYDDPAQSQASRLNIGMFQFTPTYNGNIRSCFDQWNKEYPSCSIAKGNLSAIIPAVGSSLQHFNAYCGVHKLLQTFSVQVNSSSTRNTHPDNRGSGGLKGSDSRCVTPHFYAGWAYNHFGPLQNSTGSNLSKLLKCVYSDR